MAPGRLALGAVAALSMDRIEVRGLRAYGRHGANLGEQDVAQPFDLDLDVELDLRAARASDDLADTIDYDALTRRVRATVATRSFRLLERLADEIVNGIMGDERIVRAAVRIAKPTILDGATPAVTVIATRD